MVDLFSKEKGRLQFVARGAKRDRSRVLNLTVPYVEGRFTLIRGRSHFYLKDGMIKNAHTGLQNSLHKLVSASYGVEILRAVLTQQADYELYMLLSVFLEAVEESSKDNLVRVLSAYVLKLSSFIGFRPILSRCAVCGHAVKNDAVFDPAEGGLVHREHATSTGRTLTAFCYQELVTYMRKGLREIALEEGVEGSVLLHNFLLAYFRYHTGFAPGKTVSMVKRLNLL